MGTGASPPRGARQGQVYLDRRDAGQIVHGPGDREGDEIAELTSARPSHVVGDLPGCLENHPTPNLDGMVGEAFIKPAQESDISCAAAEVHRDRAHPS